MPYTIWKNTISRYRSTVPRIPNDLVFNLFCLNWGSRISLEKQAWWNWNGSKYRSFSYDVFSEFESLIRVHTVHTNLPSTYHKSHKVVKIRNCRTWTHQVPCRICAIKGLSLVLPYRFQLSCHGVRVIIFIGRLQHSSASFSSPTGVM